MAPSLEISVSVLTNINIHVYCLLLDWLYSEMENKAFKQKQDCSAYVRMPFIVHGTHKGHFWTVLLLYVHIKFFFFFSNFSKKLNKI